MQATAAKMGAKPLARRGHLAIGPYLLADRARRACICRSVSRRSELSVAISLFLKPSRVSMVLTYMPTTDMPLA